MLRAGGDGRAGLWGVLLGDKVPVPQGFGRRGRLLERNWIVFPILLDFVPLFSCIPVSWSCSPGACRSLVLCPRAWSVVAMARRAVATSVTH